MDYVKNSATLAQCFLEDLACKRIITFLLKIPGMPTNEAFLCQLSSTETLKLSFTQIKTGVYNLS